MSTVLPALPALPHPSTRHRNLRTPGHQVLVLEARVRGAGQSGRTSAHIMQWNDDFYSAIEGKVGRWSVVGGRWVGGSSCTGSWRKGGMEAGGLGGPYGAEPQGGIKMWNARTRRPLATAKARTDVAVTSS
jgi:hypothetical protein